MYQQDTEEDEDEEDEEDEEKEDERISPLLSLRTCFFSSSL